MNTALSQRLFTSVFQQSNSLFNIGRIIVAKILFREGNLFIFVKTKIILMKKLMIPAVALAMFMASCGGVKSDAKSICDMMNKMVEAQKANDTAKIEALQKEYERQLEEMQKKYPQGSEEEKEWEALVKSCLEEAMKTPSDNDVQKGFNPANSVKPLFRIEDPNGYANLLDVPNGNKIREVYPTEQFQIEGELDGHYGVVFPNGSEGFIDTSRVILYK